MENFREIQLPDEGRLVGIVETFREAFEGFVLLLRFAFPRRGDLPAHVAEFAHGAVDFGEARVVPGVGDEAADLRFLPGEFVLPEVERGVEGCGNAGRAFRRAGALRRILFSR